MLLETAGAVCHAASVLAIALFASTELVIHEVDKRRRLRHSVHAQFLNLAQREVFSGPGVGPGAWQRMYRTSFQRTCARPASRRESAQAWWSPWL